MRKLSRSYGDRRAEMGVGTLIIFIAMVLVAAVAASVLINVVDKLQGQATDVADDTLEFFNTQVDVYNIHLGDSDHGTMDRLEISIRPMYHSGPVDTTRISLIIDGRLHFYNAYLEEIGQLTEDEQQNRHLYEFIWHNPSPKDYDDGDPYLRQGESGVIVIDLDGIDPPLDGKVGIKLIVDKGLTTEKTYRF